MSTYFFNFSKVFFSGGDTWRGGNGSVGCVMGYSTTVRRPGAASAFPRVTN